MKIKNIISLISFLCLFVSCTDDDSFSLSKSDILTFSTDTISMDTIFQRFQLLHVHFGFIIRLATGYDVQRLD